MTNIDEVNYFIGIDVSKKTLDIAILHEHEIIIQDQISNTAKGVEQFFKTFFNRGVELSQILACCEFTGIYTKHLIDYFSIKEMGLWLENAYHIKRSQGLKRGKNDKVDAIRLAHYAFRNKYDYKGFTKPRAIVEQLKTLLLQRKKLIGIRKQLICCTTEKAFRHKNINCLIDASIKNTVKGVGKDLKELNTKIITLIKSDANLTRLFTIVTSIDGVGPITAVNVIVATNEFLMIKDAKKFACYAGVVPFQYTSGTSVHSKSKVSKMANHQLKTLLHMAALSSIQMPGELRQFYLRKVMEGKNKMSVINAVRNKIVLRIFACVKNNKIYMKNYNYNLINP